MRQLLTPDDLDETAATNLVRLAVQLHDAAPSTEPLRIDGVVALVLAGPVSAATKLCLQTAIERLGAEMVRCRLTPAGLAPVRGAHHPFDPRSPVACVVSGMEGAAVAAITEQVGIPVVNAGTERGDPWPVLAEQVAQELAAARVARGAIDGMAEMRREALAPTAAAVIATIAGAVPATSSDEPTHWFG